MSANLFQDNMNKESEINFLAAIPDFTELYNAMERGESWFDVIYPKRNNNVNNLYKIENKPTESGKKRKYPFRNNTDNAPKRMRYS